MKCTWSVGARNKVVEADLVASDGRELVDSRVDEKAFEARHSKSHHRLEGEGVHIIISQLKIQYLEAWSISRNDPAPEPDIHPALTTGCIHLADQNKLATIIFKVCTICSGWIHKIFGPITFSALNSSLKTFSQGHLGG